MESTNAELFKVDNTKVVIRDKAGRKGEVRNSAQRIQNFSKKEVQEMYFTA